MGARGVPSRRAVLALPAAGLATAGLVTVTGCTGSRTDGPAEPAPVDLAAARATARTEHDLMAGYDAAMIRHPALAPLLGGLRAHHAQHLAAVAAQVPVLAAAASAEATRSAAPGGSTKPTPDVSGPTATGTPPGADDSPAGRASALAELAAAERTAADAHRASCLAATSGLAPLLASLRAAESCHADLLSIAGLAG